MHTKILNHRGHRGHTISVHGGTPVCLQAQAGECRSWNMSPKGSATGNRWTLWVCNGGTRMQVMEHVPEGFSDGESLNKLLYWTTEDTESTERKNLAALHRNAGFAVAESDEHAACCIFAIFAYLVRVNNCFENCWLQKSRVFQKNVTYICIFPVDLRWWNSKDCFCNVTMLYY